MTEVYSYNGNNYEKRSQRDVFRGFVDASVTSALILAPLRLMGRPFEKQLLKEEANNHLYKDAFEKALNVSGLKEKGVKIIQAQKDIIPSVYSSGKNACYMPSIRIVKINTDKISIAGFHEFGHAMNHLMSRSGKFLQKLRGPGYAIAGLMEYFAIFSRTKPKDAPRSATDVIEDNCGKIAFLSMCPIVAEEALASHKGIKLARKMGLTEPLINNMKKLYAKALLTYGGRAALGGLAVYAARKVMDKYTRPKLIENDTFSLFG